MHYTCMYLFYTRWRLCAVFQWSLIPHLPEFNHLHLYLEYSLAGYCMFPTDGPRPICWSVYWPGLGMSHGSVMQPAGSQVWTTSSSFSFSFYNGILQWQLLWVKTHLHSTVQDMCFYQTIFLLINLWLKLSLSFMCDRHQRSFFFFLLFFCVYSKNTFYRCL